METIKTKSGLRYKEKIYINGKAVKSPRFKRKTDAKTWRHNQLQERAKRKALGINYMPEITLNEFSKTFLLNKSNMATTTQKSYEGCLKLYLLPLFGSLKLNQVKLLHADQLRNHIIEKKLSPTRANNILKVFKILMNEAKRLEYIVKSPLEYAKPIKVMTRTHTYWMPLELNKFLCATVDDYYHNVYLVALNTGLRKGEIFGLCWDCVDFENNQLIIRRSKTRNGLKDATKSSKVRYIHMNEATREALLELNKNKKSMEYVFTKPNGEPVDYTHFTERVFKAAIKKASVNSIRFHDLRTTYASNYCMGGGEIYVLSKILGHSSVAITQDAYAHLSPKFMEKQANVVNFKPQVDPEIALKLLG